MIAAVERRADDHHGGALVTDLPHPADRFDRGVIHEWIDSEVGSSRRGDGPRHGGFPPLTILIHFAWCGVEGSRADDSRRVVWIGRRVRPSPRALIRFGPTGEPDRRLLARSLFVDPSSAADRLWAIDLCVRSAGVMTVIADGDGFGLPAMRRLQLAVEAGSAMTFLSRSSRAASQASCAATTWRVRAVPTSTPQPRWSVELVRCKGVRRWSAGGDAAPFILECDRETGSLRAPSAVADRPAKATNARLVRQAMHPAA